MCSLLLASFNILILVTYNFFFGLSYRSFILIGDYYNLPTLNGNLKHFQCKAAMNILVHGHLLELRRHFC